jgi:hypothetical protein
MREALDTAVGLFASAPPISGRQSSQICVHSYDRCQINILRPWCYHQIRAPELRSCTVIPRDGERCVERQLESVFLRQVSTIGQGRR